MQYKKQVIKALNILSISSDELFFKTKSILWEWAGGIKEYFPEFQYEIALSDNQMILSEIRNSFKKRKLVMATKSKYGPIKLNGNILYSEKEIKRYLFQVLKLYYSTWQNDYV